MKPTWSKVYVNPSLGYWEDYQKKERRMWENWANDVPDPPDHLFKAIVEHINKLGNKVASISQTSDPTSFKPDAQELPPFSGLHPDQISKLTACRQWRMVLERIIQLRANPSQFNWLHMTEVIEGRACIVVVDKPHERWVRVCSSVFAFPQEWSTALEQTTDEGHAGPSIPPVE
jgi:hypothetical protein